MKVLLSLVFFCLILKMARGVLVTGAADFKVWAYTNNNGFVSRVIGVLGSMWWLGAVSVN